MFAVQRLATLFLAASLVSTGFAATVVQGVGNFQKVDEHVYRGAQPSAEGFRNLSKLGIKTVIDLREPGGRSEWEQRVVSSAGMRYVSVPMRGMATPSNESMIKVLGLMEDSNAGPVFVHCRRGADRTGGVIACYRVEHDKWKSDRALAEARAMGMRWFEFAIQNYVRRYQPRDLAALAAKSLYASATVPAAIKP